MTGNGTRLHVRTEPATPDTVRSLVCPVDNGDAWASAVSPAGGEVGFRLQTDGSLTWQWQHDGAGPLRGDPIEFGLQLTLPDGWRFWTAWGDPRGNAVGKTDNAAVIANGWGPADYRMDWVDPLGPVPLQDAVFLYGAPSFDLQEPKMGFCPFNGELFALPLVTLIHLGRGVGLSWLLAPSDPLLDLELLVTSRGTLRFRHLKQRQGGGRAFRLTMHLVAHEPSWRGGLRWMTEHYREYFEPPVGHAAAHDLAGTGSYSRGGAPDPEESASLAAMAYRTNWQASFDFPYMGQFLPTDQPDEPWTGLHVDHLGRPLPGTRAPSTLRGMADYCLQMKERGFRVLNYFNVTEFGGNVSYPPPPSALARDSAEPDLWKDCDAFLWTRFADAIVRVPKGIRLGSPGLHTHGEGTPFYTWSGAVAVDCSVEPLRSFLLEQAERHFRHLPHSSGLCIDRIDWTRLYLPGGDDGISFFGGQSARSLLNSWRSFSADLRTLADRYGKAIFVNNHTKRLDQLRHVDGMFDEFTYSGVALNLSALLGVFKPVLGWTAGPGNLHSPTPDAFFQRYLYMGVFPMCPCSGNDHSIGPDPEAQRWYRDYGPLLSLLRGKRWVLEPGCIEADASGVCVNLFERPGIGWVAPVVLGGELSEANVTLRGQAAAVGAARAAHPGRSELLAIAIERIDPDACRLRVPLVRGAAVLVLETGGEEGEP